MSGVRTLVLRDPAFIHALPVSLPFLWGGLHDSPGTAGPLQGVLIRNADEVLPKQLLAGRMHRELQRQNKPRKRPDIFGVVTIFSILWERLFTLSFYFFCNFYRSLQHAKH